MKSPIDLVKGSIDIIRSDPKLILGIVTVPFSLTLVSVLFDPTRQMGPVSDMHTVISAVSWVFLFVFTNTVVIVALLLALDGAVSRIKESYRSSLGFLLRFLPLVTLWYLAVIVILMPFYNPGLILLVWVIFAIPAIMTLVWMIFSELILVLEDVTLVDACKQGWKLLTSSWWPLFGRLLFLLFVVWVSAIVAEALFRALGAPFWVREVLSTVLFYLVFTFMITYLYLLYKDTKTRTMVSAL